MTNPVLRAMLFLCLLVFFSVQVVTEALVCESVAIPADLHALGHAAAADALQTSPFALAADCDDFGTVRPLMVEDRTPIDITEPGVREAQTASLPADLFRPPMARL